MDLCELPPLSSQAMPSPPVGEIGSSLSDNGSQSPLSGEMSALLTEGEPTTPKADVTPWA
jgi:hypothetical protein